MPKPSALGPRPILSWTADVVAASHFVGELFRFCGKVSVHNLAVFLVSGGSEG